MGIVDCKTCMAYEDTWPDCLCTMNPKCKDYYQPKAPDPADEWRYGYTSKQGKPYLTVNDYGDVERRVYGEYPLRDAFRISMGNCFPDSPRGKLLAEAWAKYAPIRFGQRVLIQAMCEYQEWLEAGMNMTIEEAKKVAGGE